MDGEKGGLLLTEFPTPTATCQGSAVVEKSLQIADKLQGIKIVSTYWRNKTIL